MNEYDTLKILKSIKLVSSQFKTKTITIVKNINEVSLFGFKNEIFEPTFTTKKEDEGIGIGLYMSKIIITQNMDGTLESNNVNITYTGAEFEISLPLYN